MRPPRTIKVGPHRYTVRMLPGIGAAGAWGRCDPQALHLKHTTGSTWDELIDFIGPENYHTIDTYGPSLVSKGQFESEDDYHFSQP